MNFSKLKYALILIFSLVCSWSYAGESILFIASKHWSVTFNLHTFNEWRSAGYEVKTDVYENIKTYDDLKRFNVVVLNTFPFIGNDGKIDPAQANFEKICRNYMENGGSVIVNCAGGEWGKGVPAVNSFLEPYGVKMLEEQLVDTQNFLGKTDKVAAFYFTRAITKHPITENIKKLGFCGVALRADAMKTASPLVFSTSELWTVLAAGEKTAKSVKAAEPGNSAKLESTPATYKTSPPYIAIRQIGKGFLMVDAENSAFSSASPEVFNNILWRKDDMTTPDLPQNRTFLFNAVKFLAAGSAKHNMGGFKTPGNFIPDAKNVLNGPNTDWGNVQSLKKTLPDFEAIYGLIGAQSNYSGGKYSVADLVKAAKNQKLGFLVFTEKLENMNAAKYEALKKECKQLSNEDFLAVPGLLSKDKFGNCWFAFGAVKNYPQVPSVTPDGKKLDNSYQFNAKNFGLRMTGFAFAGKNPNLPKEMKHCSGYGVFTSVNGVSVDDSLTDYFRSCQDMEFLMPFSFTLADSPEAIKKTVESIPINVFTGEDADELADYIAGQGYGLGGHTEMPKRWYIAQKSGNDTPTLLQFGAIAGGFGVNIKSENRGAFAFSLANLKSDDIIKLNDGKNLIRQWVVKPENQGKFFQEFRWPIDKTKVFVLSVSRDDKTILLTSAVRFQYGSFFNQCGDIQNTIPYVYLPDENNRIYVSGTPIEMKYRSWAPNIGVYAPVKVWALPAVGLEVTPLLYSTWSGGADLMIPESLERRASLASYHEPILSSADIMIVDEICDRVYPGGGRHWGDCKPPQPTRPLKNFNYNSKKFAIYGRIKPGQINAQYQENSIKILEDIELESPYIEVAVPAMHEATHAEYLSGGKTANAVLSEKPNRNLKLELISGDYLGFYPFGVTNGGGVFAVDMPLYAYLRSTAGSSSYKIKVPKKLKKGDEIKYKMLFTNGGSIPFQAESDYKRIRKHFGFEGGFPALADIKNGRLVPNIPVMPQIAGNPDKTLEINTVKTPDAPCGLTFRISGLNPNWLYAYRLNDEDFLRFAGNDGSDFYIHSYVDLQPNRIQAAHLMTADDSEVIINLNDFKGNYRSFEIYNPSSIEKSVKLKSNADLIKINWEKTVILPPLSSTNLTIE